MASKSSQPKPQLLILAIALLTISSLFSAASAGRPCKTLLISSFSFSLRRDPHLPPSSGGFVTVFTQISDPSADDDDLAALPRPDVGPTLRLFDLHPYPHHPHPHGPHPHPHGPHPHPHGPHEAMVGPGFPFPFPSSYDMSSLRDRTRDILSVVVALLFGVGCGALTAATMYLAWSLFAGPRHGYGEGFDSSSESDDEIPSPKKVGYVKIPAQAEDLAKPTPA